MAVTVCRCCAFFILLLSFFNLFSAGSDKIKLVDVGAITLSHKSYTTGRRSSAVPQLKCIGGSAGCQAFVPQVVQCKNQGSDGFDVQWKCETADMPNKFKFGKIQVSCEGYDYPDDPFILKGSCGLEYTIDHAGHGSSSYSSQNGDHKSSGLGFFLLIVVIGCIILLYKCCISPNVTVEDYRYRQHQGHFGSGGGGAPPDDYPSAPPPPPGFRPEYGSDNSETRFRDSHNYSSPPPPYSSHNYGSHTASPPYQGSSTYTTTENRNPNTDVPNSTAGTNQGPGFWSGLATGGLLGYMFGGRNRHHGTGYHCGYNTGVPRSSGWFGNSGANSWWSTGNTAYHSSSGYSPSASRCSSSFSGGGGSRTASGYGGTSRR